MEDEQLKAIWKASTTRMQQINLHSINSNMMNEQIKKFDKTISRRNNLEVLVAIFCIAIFGVFAYIKPNPLAKIGAIMLVFYGLHVIYQLRKTENKQPNFDMMRSLKEQLMDYQTYVKAEQKLSKNILYWYLLPMLPGLILFLIGCGMRWLPGLIYFGVIVPFGFALVYYLHQKSIKHRIQPLLADIAKTLESLEELG